MQVVQPQDAHNGSCPVLRIQAAAAAAHPTASPASLHDPEPLEQHLIPWVPAIVQSIHPPSRTVVINPPPGLLELGRRQQLLQKLKPQLMAHGKPAVGSMADRLGQHFMPTKRQLAAAGREDLAKLVTAAGGFIHVAHLLGLRAKRKPEGQQAPRVYVQSSVHACTMVLDSVNDALHTSGFCCASADAKMQAFAWLKGGDHTLMLYKSLTILPALSWHGTFGQAAPSTCVDLRCTPSSDGVSHALMV